ncbi:hypothetical protein GOODEAATRI_011014 [Goodea atripinnis]|uniref:Uncharacterized protein n=1 Tax=Goodea atripinnis TaxID=208336 RepID=A0ABV0MRS0_9TELE
MHNKKCSYKEAELSADPLSLVARHVYMPWSSTVILSIWRVASCADKTMPDKGSGKRLFNTNPQLKFTCLRCFSYLIPVAEPVRLCTT